MIEVTRERLTKGGRTYRAPALEKGLDILELLASNGAPMAPVQIATALDRSMGELFRLILVLEDKKYIFGVRGGAGYELSNKLFTLGMSQAPVQNLLEVALPAMRELSDVVGQSCHLAVPSEDQMVVIARIENPGYLGFSVRPGYRRCLTESSSGVTLFAFQPKAVRAAWSRRLSKIVSENVLESFPRRAETVLARGYERKVSDFVQGVTDISCPIMSGKAAAAALTIPYLLSASSPAGVDLAVEDLKAAANRVSEGLVPTL